MSLKARVITIAVGWIVLISGLHAYLNVDWASILNEYRPESERKFNVAYIPVTCHLARAPSPTTSRSFQNQARYFSRACFKAFQRLRRH
jgi:NitT/TauT family transport system substrate-binding protein